MRVELRGIDSAMQALRDVGARAKGWPRCDVKQNAQDIDNHSHNHTHEPRDELSDHGAASAFVSCCPPSMWVGWHRARECDRSRDRCLGTMLASICSESQAARLPQDKGRISPTSVHFRSISLPNLVSSGPSFASFARFRPIRCDFVAHSAPFWTTPSTLALGVCGGQAPEDLYRRRAGGWLGNEARSSKEVSPTSLAGYGQESVLLAFLMMLRRMLRPHTEFGWKREAWLRRMQRCCWHRFSSQHWRTSGQNRQIVAKIEVWPRVKPTDDQNR